LYLAAYSIKTDRTMIRAITAFLATILTGLQAVLLIIGKDGICLNEGCRIVDSFPKLPPLYFNIAGAIYFCILFWCFLKGRKGSEYWHRFAKLLLLAGLATEAVLLFFQYSIVTAFCSYCLIIFSFIFLLNILCGLRHLFSSLVISVSVFVMLSSLQLRAVSTSDMSLAGGSFARIGEESENGMLYLFFSETCEHCENVISIINENNRCDLRFNPVEYIDHFSLTKSSRFANYDPKINVAFLKSLNIKEIPVLVATEQERVVVLKGEGRIKKYLEEQCLSGEEVDYSGTSQTVGSDFGYLPVLNPAEEGCSVEEDCEKSVE